jgi:hypothetical protein
MTTQKETCPEAGKGSLNNYSRSLQQSSDDCGHFQGNDGQPEDDKNRDQLEVDSAQFGGEEEEIELVELRVDVSPVTLRFRVDPEYEVKHPVISFLISLFANNMLLIFYATAFPLLTLFEWFRRAIETPYRYLEHHYGGLAAKGYSLLLVLAVWLFAIVGTALFGGFSG